MVNRATMIGRPVAAARLQRALLCAVALLAITARVPALAQGHTDSNFVFPVRAIEERLRIPTIQIEEMERSRQMEADRSLRVTLAAHGDEPPMQAHWKPVAPPGQGFNNEPRYILAAYEFQKLFLDESDYVAPPVVLRVMTMDEYRNFRPVWAPTISGTRSVLFLLAYWIQNISIDTVDPYSRELFERDSLYARHFAHANLFTHLIDHKDGNHGNVVVSMDAFNRRVFSLDNDVAFRSRPSDLGTRWRRLHIDRLPARTVERLRAITREDLERTLAVVAEFEIVDGHLRPVAAGPNLRADRGLRVQDGRVQFGLTTAEINDVQQRIQRLLSDVDRGRIRTF